MADVTADEITRISTTPVGSLGYDLVVIEVYIEHTFANNDDIFASDLGLEKLLGVLGATYVDSSNITQATGIQDLLIGEMLANSRTIFGAQAASMATLPTAGDNDKVTVGASLIGAEGLWLLLLGKVNG